LERLESRDVPAVFHVTTLTDGIGNGSLRDAIMQSNATPGHNDIQFDVTGTHALSAQYGELLITNSDLTIDAQAQEEIIDGGRQHFRVLHIRGGNDTTTTLIGLTITNGQAEGDSPDGGGIDMVSRGTTLTLIGVTVSDCSAHGSGGIYACAGNASLFGCTIRNNTSNGQPGGAGCFAGVTICDSTFDGNQGGQGGALYVNGEGPATIRTSTFSNNVGSQGGAIASEGGTFLDCTFVGNTAGSGGAVDANRVTVSGCTFSNNSATGGGGALITSGQLTNSTFDHNSAAVDGGGLAVIPFSTRTLDISGCTFSNNTAGQYGGGVADSGRVRFTNCTLAGNSAGRDGGGLYVGNVAVTLDYCTLAANNAGLAANVGHGGGIFVSGGPLAHLLLHASIVALNTATDGVDIFGVVTSQGYNLIGNSDSSTGWTDSDTLGTTGQEIDPRLDPLGNYGGPTQTMRLRADSPAVASGDPNDFPLTDQRGRLRPAASVPCIGAFELYPDDLG
jgi:predicted outer membrane repeat protein